jgi:putative acetyltransferase
MRIRDWQPDDATALRAVFESAVHRLAGAYYTREQCAAWASAAHDRAAWAGRLARNAPFVVELDGRIAAFADLQPDGGIDMFFVHADAARRGVGATLLAHIERTARQRGNAALRADVSLAAEAFFTRYGFTVVARRIARRNGVDLANARMRKILAPGAA